MGMSTTLQNALLAQFFASERFMSLHLASPGAVGSYAAEVASAGTGYARQSLLSKLSAPSGGLVVNTLTVTFPVILAQYGVVTDFAAGDSVSGGTLGLFGSFDVGSLKGIGQAYQFAPGTIRFQFR